MSTNTIYKRTLKGEEEITKRTHKIDHFHRFVLIMIDGKASKENIISRSSPQWRPGKCLNLLESQGFIINIDSTNNASTGGEPPICDLKQDLIAKVQQLIPNNNVKIINKIRKSETRKQSISDAIDSSCIFVKLTISEKIAQQLKTELHTILENCPEIN